MKIGAHVSAGGGLPKAIDRAVEIGAETVQIFGSSPQMWGTTKHSDEDKAAFRARAAEAGVGPAFLHGIYLINLATPNETNLKRGVGSLVSHMILASEIGAAGVIFHPGSHKGEGFDQVLPRVAGAMREVLERTPEDALLIIETNAGAGDCIGDRFAEVAAMMDAVKSPRVKVCFDTCHVYVSGYDITTAEGVARTMEEFQREIGLEHLVAVHANDAKAPLGSNKDRHENIGQGHIGIAGFEHVMAHPAFAEVPFLLEVPGFAGQGPDRENVEILKEIRGRVRPRTAKA
ncbi:MAG TPA: deoxyribonuclease IV [Dehalococcoidia bacterium]